MKVLFVLTAVAQAQATAFGIATAPGPASAASPAARRHYDASAKSAAAASTRHGRTALAALSPATVGGILIRGGAAVADPVLGNYYGDALGFFSGIRIPASFLAGSSLAAMFSLKSSVADMLDDERGGDMAAVEKRVIRMYHFTSLFAFLLSLNTIMTAQIATTSILHGRFDAMAETAYLLMKREFLYEFVTVRWSFLTSMFMFLGMVASRMLIEFGLLKPGEGGNSSRRNLSTLVVCSIGALAANLMSYVNTTLWCWRSLFGMTIYLARMVLTRAFVERRPLQMVFMLCTAGSLVSLWKLLFPTEQDKE